jgi:polysaccharide export outer membrane protein
MKLKRKNIIYSVFCVILIFSSCSTKKQILYLQDSDQFNNATVGFSSPNIQRNDIISVQFNALKNELAEPYNKQMAQNGGGQGMMNVNMMGYLVSDKYTINLPIIGTIDVKNKTTKELENYLRLKMINEGRLTELTVEVLLLNGKYTILGDIGGPGTYTFNESNVTILQAIGSAGDLRMSGRRHNIKVIREENGVQKVGQIDITSNDIINSPYYYVRQNDIIYVEPNGPRVTSAGFITNWTGVISAFTLIFTTISLLIR